MHFSNKYKLIKISDSIFRLKRLYRFQSNGWETIFKQLRFNDNGLVIVKNNKIIYVLDFTKQFIVTILGLITLFIIFWKALNFSVLLSLIIILIPALIIWFIIFLDGNAFIDTMVNDLKNKIRY
jgi:hypothetical protein